MTRYGLASTADITLLDAAMRVAAFTEPEFYRRVEVLETLWMSVHPRLPATVPVDVYRFYSAHVSANRQLRPRTIADEVTDRYAEQFGPDVYDLTNYLMPGRFEELASLDENETKTLPPPWRALALSLRDQVRHDLACTGCVPGAAGRSSELTQARTGTLTEARP